MQTPLVSVIVPTYNRRDSLQVTLDGLARQTLPAHFFEVLVVSDGSTDGTDAMLAAHAPRAPYRLRPLIQSNAGPSRARNLGASEAAGELLVFIDDDVEPQPDCLSAHVRVHRHKERAAVIGPMAPDSALRGVEPHWIAWEHAMLRKNVGSFPTDRWSTVSADLFYTGNGSARREHVLGAGGFDESFRRQEDVELAARLQRQYGVEFLYEPRAMALHRPTRSFESWMSIPHSYGALDVRRAREGNVPWSRVQHGYHGRNRATRLLADLTLGSSTALRATLSLLLTGAAAAYRVGACKPAMAALSAAYNLRYLQGVQEELGTRGRVREHLGAAAQVAASPSLTPVRGPEPALMTAGSVD